MTIKTMKPEHTIKVAKEVLKEIVDECLILASELERLDYQTQIPRVREIQEKLLDLAARKEQIQRLILGLEAN